MFEAEEEIGIISPLQKNVLSQRGKTVMSAHQGYQNLPVTKSHMRYPASPKPLNYQNLQQLPRKKLKKKAFAWDQRESQAQQDFNNVLPKSFSPPRDKTRKEMKDNN